MKNILKYSFLSFLIFLFSSCTTLFNTISIRNENINYRDLVQKEKEKLNLKIINTYKNKLKTENNLSLKINTDFFSKKQDNNNSFVVQSFSNNKRVKNLISTNNIKNNIFNIDDPKSLSGLDPYQGDFTIGDPSFKSRIGGMKIDQSSNINFEQDVLIIKFDNPSDFSIFKNLYDAEIIEEIDGFYRVKVNLEKSPYNKIEELIEKHNTKIATNISNIEFSSVNSMKLFCIILDFYLNNKTSLKTLAFNLAIRELPTRNPDIPYTDDWNQRFDSNFSVKPTNLNIKSPLPDVLKNRGYGANHSGWPLRSTDTIEAWNYSIGTKVKLAWIEAYQTYVQDHPEIKRRLKNYGDSNISNFSAIPDSKISGEEKFNKPESYEFHGHYALMTCCAERENDVPSVGVAPNLEVNPYSVFFIFSGARAIDLAIAHGANVIGFNMSWDDIDPFICKVLDSGAPLSILPLGLLMPDNMLDNAIDRSHKKNIPVIVAAHNYGNNIMDRNVYPANLANVLTVGYLQKQPNVSNYPLDTEVMPRPPLQIAYSSTANFWENGKGSNWGKPGMVFGPGEDLDVARYKIDTSKIPDFYKGDISSEKANRVHFSFSGTSGATPFVTGVVCLMKSVNPDLGLEDLLEIFSTLSGTGRGSDAIIPLGHPMRDTSIHTRLAMVNTLDAVRMAIAKKEIKEIPLDQQSIYVSTPSKFPSVENKYRAKNLDNIGYFKLNDNTLNNNDTNNKVIGTITFNDGGKKNVLRTTSDEEFNKANNSLVVIKGWTDYIKVLNNTDVEVLSIKTFVGKPKITSLSQTSNNQIYNIKVDGENFYKYPDFTTAEVTLKNKSTNKINTFFVKSNPSNNGKEFSFSIENKVVSTSIVNGVKIETREFDKGDYGVSIKFGSDNKSATDFSDVSITNGQNTFKVYSTISYNNQQIPVIENGSTTQVHKGDTIAIKIDPTWIDSEWVIDSSKSIKLSDVINEYAITKVPPYIPEKYQALLIQYTLNGTGQYVTYEKALEILSYPDSFFYQGRNIPVVATGTNTMVTSGSKIALPMTDALIQRLQNIDFNDGYGNKLTYYELVNNYAILGIPPTLSSSVRDIVIKNLSTGKVELTYEQALYKAALAMNLNPVTPPDAITLPDSDEFPPFIYDNTSLNVHPGDLVAAALYGLSKNDNVTVTVNGQSMPIYDQKDGYVAFKIQGNAGVYDVKISNQYDEVVFNKSLRVFAHNKIAFSKGDDNGQSQIYTINPDGTDLTKISDTYGYSLAWSLDKSKLAYGYWENGFTGYKIYIMDYDGNNKKQVSNPVNASDDYPVWSFDGSNISFVRYHDNGNVSLMITDGITERILSTDKYVISSSISFSHDGQNISYVGLNNGLYVVNKYGGNNHQISHSYSLHSGWTNDGKIVYESDYGISKINPDTTEETLLSEIGRDPIVSLDGTKIAFYDYTFVTQDPSVNIYVMNTDGTNLKNVANVPYGNFGDISWSATSKSIIFRLYNYNNYNYELYSVNIDGTNKRLIDLDLKFNYFQYNRWSIKSDTKSQNNKRFRTDRIAF